MADREYYKEMIDDAMRKVLSPEHQEHLLRLQGRRQQPSSATRLRPGNPSSVLFRPGVKSGDSGKATEVKGKQQLGEHLTSGSIRSSAADADPAAITPDAVLADHQYQHARNRSGTDEFRFTRSKAHRGGSGDDDGRDADDADIQKQAAGISSSPDGGNPIAVPASAAAAGPSYHEDIPMLEIPDHGPAEVYPEDPELEVEYIMQRFKKMYSKIPEQIWAKQTRVDDEHQRTIVHGDDKYFNHLNIHSQLLWRDIIQEQDPLARMKGICQFIIVFSAGLFKPDTSSDKKLDVLPIGEHVLQRKNLEGVPGISLYLQEQTTYSRPIVTPEQFATGKIYGSLVLPLYPTAKFEGPFMTIDFTKNENCTIRIMKESRVLPQSKPGFDDDYGVLSGMYPEDGNQEDEVYTFNLPSLRMSRLTQGLAVSELVGICKIQCKQTRMEAELRFLPQLMLGIRGRCVVDGVVRPMVDPNDVKTNVKDDTLSEERGPELEKENKSLWTKASNKVLKMTGLRTRQLENSNLEVDNIWPAHYTEVLDPPALLSILGHWDRKVLVRNEHSGEVGVLHNDPLVMRADHEPILDAPLNGALRLPGSMIMRRLWSAIVDAIDIHTWPEPLNSVLKTQMLAQRFNHVKQKREEAGVPLAYQLTYMFADHPTVGELIRLPTKSKAQKDAEQKADKEADSKSAQKAAVSCEESG